LEIGIIGAGKAGTAFMMGLIKQNVHPTGVCDINPDAVKRIKSVADDIPVVPMDVLTEISDTILLTVNDDHIRQTAERIAGFNTVNLKGKLFIHISGACGLDVLNSIQKAGGDICSLHPLQTFADYDNAWKGLYNIYFGYTGDERHIDILTEMVSKFDSKIIRIKEENKPLYHAAACVFSNYTVALFNVAESLAKDAGLEKETILEAFKPLINKTVTNIYGKGTLNSLTGPIARGDVLTVENHIEHIKDETTLKLYKILGLKALSMTMENGREINSGHLELKEILQR
jgi:predicted short-subunit dehydrogenase-like oxidoreductase (DUF2520 family)